jgi:glycosyltransferase involved in cell wall biosynthesis
LSGSRYLLPQLNTKLFRPVRAVSHFLAGRAINCFRPDILHETYYSENTHRPQNARHVLTVYDLIHERYSNMFENSHVTTKAKLVAVNRADHVICISESTRFDLINYCGVPKEKTSVVHLGVNNDFMKADKFTQKQHCRPFLLYVGARRGYKNFRRFIQAFARSIRLRQEYDIICFGGGAFHESENQTLLSIGLRPEQVIFMSGDDKILASLYQQASAFVYPSIYEGFGIPPLEAMASKCPVICSNTSSIPEVVGDAAEYFDPLKEDAILNAMELVLESPSRQKKLIAAGEARFKQFTWEKCAKETEEIYRKLL